MILTRSRAKKIAYQIIFEIIDSEKSCGALDNEIELRASRLADKKAEYKLRNAVGDLLIMLSKRAY